MPLTDTVLRSIRNPAKVKRYADGGGLYLEATPAGGRYWRLKYRYARKEYRLAFGVYPDVSLKDARIKRDDARKLLSNGVDPGEVRRAIKLKVSQDAENTFESVARKWVDHAAAVGKSNRPWTPQHKNRTLANLEADVFPFVGKRPMSQTTDDDVKAVIKKLNNRGVGELASRTYQRIGAVFKYAVTELKCIAVNPLLNLTPSSVVMAHETKPRASMPLKEVPAFLAKLDTFDGDAATRWGLYMLMLTAVRPGELRGMLWEEIDTEAALWRIPAERMKMRLEHLVPLSTQALEVLEAVKPLATNSGLVFPSPYYPAKSLSENTFNSALSRMGYKGIATAHGFRALFSSTANECGWNPDAIERQLSHVETNEVRGAYNRAKYIGERKELMQWWADYLDAKRTADVIPIRRKSKKA